jgi:hypothetical protein
MADLALLLTFMYDMNIASLVGGILTAKECKLKTCCNDRSKKNREERLKL